MKFDMDKARAQIAAKNRVREQHPELFQWLADLLARHDPMGLVDMGAPEDEYEPEVGTILPRLVELQPEEQCDAELIQRIVVEEFQRWFDTRQFGLIGRHEAIAREIADTFPARFTK